MCQVTWGGPHALPCDNEAKFKIRDDDGAKFLVCQKHRDYVDVAKGYPHENTWRVESEL